MQGIARARCSLHGVARVAVGESGWLRSIWWGSPSLVAKVGGARLRALAGAAGGWHPIFISFLLVIALTESRVISIFSSIPGVRFAFSITYRFILLVFIRIEPSFGVPSWAYALPQLVLFRARSLSLIVASQTKSWVPPPSSSFIIIAFIAFTPKFLLYFIKISVYLLSFAFTSHIKAAFYALVFQSK